MTRMILDAATAAKLFSVTSDTELFDPAGNVVGIFTPSRKAEMLTEAGSAIYDRNPSPILARTWIESAKSPAE